MAESVLAFSPFRRAIVHAVEHRLWIHEPAGTMETESTCPITAIAPYGDGVLFATSEPGTQRAEILRLRHGERVAARIAELPHEVASISVGAAGTHALFLGSRTSLVELASEAVTTSDATERAVVLGEGRWVSLRRSAIELHNAHAESDTLLAIRREGHFVFADTLGEPSSLVFVHNQPTHSFVQHLNVRTRVASTGLLVPLSSTVRVARARRMALLWSTAAEQVYLLDLRIGRLLASRGLPPEVSDVDIDASAEEVALERDGKLVVMSLSALMSGRGGIETPAAHADEDDGAGAAEVSPLDEVESSGDDQSLEQEVAIALGEIPALPLLAAPEPLHPALAELFLDRVFGLVAALSSRAIASAWSSGRLAFFEPTALPYQGEVDALLRRHTPRAAAQVSAADAELVAAARLCSFIWNDAVLAPGDRIVHRDLGDPLATEIDWPLRTLARDFDLSPVACDILLALIAPSSRPEFARLYAIIRNDPARPLCDEMLLDQLLEPRAPAVAIAAELERDAPLLRHGLVRRGEGERIFAPLTANPAVMARLRAMELPDPERARVEGPTHFWIAKDHGPALARALADAEPPLRLLIRGRRSAGRRTLARMIARATRRLCVEIDVQAVSKKDTLGWVQDRMIRASILGHLPVISGLDEPDLDGEVHVALIRMVRDHRGPLILRGGPEWTPGLELPATAVDLPRLSETGRRQVWQDRLESFPGITPSTIDTLATRHAVGPGRIVAVTERLAGTDSPASVIETIEARLADARESRLGAVATRVRKLTRWDDVVLPDDVWQRIQELMARVKYKRQVYETWGFQNVATTALGITALFQGGPGTGKTLVAGAIARELDYELYRVDVSRIVSKWIGETEKNLATIFDSAEDGRLVLLFDEADTLFAKRTEVKSSVDRYANSEVNFLLQRLDTFHGVAILTTNRPGAMDPAFQRRLSMAVAFPEPDEEMREKIWQVHIPKAVPRAPELDLAEIARQHQFSGGHIRNAVMRALFFAASEGTPLTQAHLTEAIRLEYQNLGKLSQGGAVGS